jgi:hypothetical protein
MRGGQRCRRGQQEGTGDREGRSQCAIKTANWVRPVSSYELVMDVLYGKGAMMVSSVETCFSIWVGLAGGRIKYVHVRSALNN